MVHADHMKMHRIFDDSAVASSAAHLDDSCSVQRVMELVSLVIRQHRNLAMDAAGIGSAWFELSRPLPTSEAS